MVLNQQEWSRKNTMGRGEIEIKKSTGIGSDSGRPRWNIRIISHHPLHYWLSGLTFVEPQNNKRGEKKWWALLLVSTRFFLNSIFDDEAGWVVIEIGREGKLGRKNSTGSIDSLIISVLNRPLVRVEN